MSIVVSTPSSAGAGADFDDGFAAAELGQQAEQRADRRGDRTGTDIGGALARGQQHRVLSDRPLGVRREGLRPSRRRLARGVIGGGHARSVDPTQVGCSQARPVSAPDTPIAST
jgi:hypothetical protein